MKPIKKILGFSALLVALITQNIILLSAYFSDTKATRFFMNAYGEATIEIIMFSVLSLFGAWYLIKSITVMK